MEKIKSPPYVVKRARELRGNQTPAERILWDCLRDGRLTGAKFRRQHPLGRYIADFCCHKARLVVELEGDIHNRSDQKQYDEVRKHAIEQLGLRVISFKNANVMQDVDSVLAKMGAALTPGPSLSGRGVAGGRGEGRAQVNSQP